jgi:glycogen operon protein
MSGLAQLGALSVCEAGKPWPMGASCQTKEGQVGVNFAVFSRNATRLEVCLFEACGQVESSRFPLPVCTDGIWHGFVAGLRAGQLYGLRAFGPYAPTLGHRFNPAKLLIDPFARALHGPTQLLSLEFDYAPPWTRSEAAQPDPEDNAARIPKAQVLDLEAERQAGAALMPAPRTALNKTILYEAHVKGLTQRHPDVPMSLRGTYAGLVSAPMLAHFQRLGITTICLLPVQLFITEAQLLEKGLSNYWGYNTLGYFMPEPRYASAQFADVRTEFRHMVNQLHEHGLEVVLDVVFNHSAESDALGPTLSWRGLDNASWYAQGEGGATLNFSGCGNSFNLSQPCALQMVMDSLRWWVQAFGVDGFRFDLATTLGRDPALNYHFHAGAGLLSAIGQDPVLSGVKLLSEPWDVGPQGYQLGQFPAGWCEWNDRFRDTARAYWLGHDCTRGEMARRLTGSSDYFAHEGRGPLASINLITAHDGMTLADLTTYREKHNLANGENNQDGHSQNFSANAGLEGPSHDAAVLALRGQWQRALLATLFCAQGVPQLLAGDELGYSQQGNNNAYCQDNETTWLDWASADQAHTFFVAGLIQLRHAHPALRHEHYFTGTGSPDIAWRKADGATLSAADWESPLHRSFACVIEVGEAGVMATERWMLMFHPGPETRSFALPPGDWWCALDSAQALLVPAPAATGALAVAQSLALSACTVVGLVQPVVPHKAAP